MVFCGHPEGPSDLFQCANGKCLNITLLCTGVESCGDQSEVDYIDDFCPKDAGFEVTSTLVAGIVLGVIVGIALLCCLVGTVVDCLVHVYKYWRFCWRKVRPRGGSRGDSVGEMIQLRTPRPSPADSPVYPTIMVRSLPPSYSAISLTCEPIELVEEELDPLGPLRWPPPRTRDTAWPRGAARSRELTDADWPPPRGVVRTRGELTDSDWPSPRRTRDFTDSDFADRTQRIRRYALVYTAVPKSPVESLLGELPPSYSSIFEPGSERRSLILNEDPP